MTREVDRLVLPTILCTFIGTGNAIECIVVLSGLSFDMAVPLAVPLAVALAVALTVPLAVALTVALAVALAVVLAVALAVALTVAFRVGDNSLESLNLGFNLISWIFQ